MADSQVVRNRRSRKHRAGDHGECIPGNCEAVTPEVGDDVTSAVTEPERHHRPNLGPAGSQLWLDLTSAGPVPPMQRVLLVEACRIADRLDKLDAQLRGEESEWLTLGSLPDGRIAIVIVDKALAEARQQATALKAIIAELRQAAGGARAPGRPLTGSNVKPQGGKGGSISDLAAHAAKRGAASAS